MKEKIAALLKDLVAFESTADHPENLRAIVAFVRNYLGEKIPRFDHEKNGKPSVVYSFTGDKHPRVLFVGHLDVVPGNPEQFQPRIEGDRLYGRGALDMKGPDAVMIQLFRDLAESDTHPPIALMLTTDEEVGSKDGVEYLLKEEGWKADFAVIPDGGSNFALVIEGKGVLHFKVTAKGKAAHGSIPWQGENAIDKLIAFYQAFRSHFPVEPCGDPAHWHETLNLGRLCGGDAPNRVPDHAEMLLDTRFPHPWTVERMRRMAQETAQGFPDLELEFLSEGPPVFTPKDHPLVQRYKAIAEEVLGREVAFTREYGATDGRFFTEQGIPVITTYPVGEGLHTAEEWVDLNSLAQLYEIFRRFVTSAL